MRRAGWIRRWSSSARQEAASQSAPGRDHVYHVYVVRTAQREALRAELDRQGIQTALHYPAPCHAQPAWAGRSGDLALTNAEAVAGEVLSLPMFPEMSEAQVERVIAAVRSFFA